MTRRMGKQKFMEKKMGQGREGEKNMNVCIMNEKIFH
jgi:hypothetical protein